MTAAAGIARYFFKENYTAMRYLEKAAQAGTFESNDILITVEPMKKSGIEIELESAVIFQFGQQIKTVIRETIEAQEVDCVRVYAVDKGALDITVKARTETALERAGIEIREE